MCMFELATAAPSAVRGCGMSVDARKTEKKVLAIHCFLDMKRQNLIDDTCRNVAKRLGDTFCPGYSGHPHITLASWLVTREELEEAQSVFADRLTDVPSVTVSTRLGAKERENQPDSVSYFLFPDTTQELIQFHAHAHKQLAYPYESQREIDLPGKWWPHLTLFKIPREMKDAIRDDLNVLANIQEVTITRLGLVTFYPTTTVSEVVLPESK